MASRAPVSSRRQVGPFQFLALVMAFVMLCTVGGVVGAGLLIPFADGVNVATDNAITLFDELPEDIRPTRPSESSRMYYSDGSTLMATFYAENREVKDLKDMAPILQDAVTATEDRRFFEHGAIDFEGLPRAVVANLSNDKQGASTLTQQYVKNVLIEKAIRSNDPIEMFKASEATLGRKAREAKLAISLEEQLSKGEILAGYMNIAQFGVGIYGVEAAAQRYFSKSAAEVNYVEAATIAGITKEPSRYDPAAALEILHTTGDPKPLEIATNRRDTVLKTMLQEGKITPEEFEAGTATPIQDTLHVQDVAVGCIAAGSAAFFCDYVTRFIQENPAFGETPEERKDMLYRGGLRITTSLDAPKQQAAYEAAVAAVPPDIPATKRGQDYYLEDVVVSVEPGTGYIRAMAQNRPYAPNALTPGMTTLNLSTDQSHGGSKGFSPGSTWKVFTLAEWIRSGRSVHESVNANQREFILSRDFRGARCGVRLGPEKWKPGNADGSTDKGSIPVSTATVNSVNTAFVDMETKIDLCDLRDTAWNAGFRPSLYDSLRDAQGNTVLAADIDPRKPETLPTSRSVETFPAMTLGVQVTSPMHMANAFATFAAGGTYCTPLPIVSYATSKDSTEQVEIPQNCTVGSIEPRVANTVSGVLSGIHTKIGGGLEGGRVFAGKTGTAQDNTHNWFVGYTPQLSTAVWIGNAENNVPMQSMSIPASVPGVRNFQGYWYGSTLAGPTWKMYMNRALAGYDPVPFPAVVETPRARPGQGGAN